MKKFCILVMLFVYLSFTAQNRVVDGDTFYISGEKIRLANVDAPEKFSHPFERDVYSYACRRLKEAKKITVNRITKDKYGRTIAYIYLDGKDLGYELVQKGYCFVYYKYCNNINYLEAEQKAKEKNLGVWKYNLVKPWVYRKTKH